MTEVVNLRKKQEEKKIREEAERVAQKLVEMKEIEKPVYAAPIVAPVQPIATPAIITPPHHTEAHHFEWDVLIFHSQSKRTLYSIVAGLCMGALLIYLFQDNPLLSIIFLLAAVAMVLHSTKEPEPEKIVINHAGVRWGERHHKFKDLRSFWIEYQPGGLKELILESHKWYLPHIKIPLEDRSPVQLRNLMIKFLPEEEHEYSIFDHLSRRM